MSAHSIDADRFATAQKAEAERWDRVAHDDEANSMLETISGSTLWCEHPRLR